MALLGGVVGCGADDLVDKNKTGDNTGSDSNAPSHAGMQASAMVTAAAGGQLNAGAAGLSVPAGAVSGDLTVTVKVEDKSGKPDADKILLDIYDFGPDGTKFLKPVDLTFDMKGVTIDESKGKAMIAWLDDAGKWNTVPTTVADGKAVGQTTHFTPFTLVFVLNDDGHVQQTGGLCDGSAFDACGGDVVGTWEFTAACATVPGIGNNDSSDGGAKENPFAMCDEQPSYSLTVDITGTAEFKQDGSANVDQTITASGSLFLPESCLKQLGGDQATCDIINAKPTTGGCTAGDESAMPNMQNIMVTGTYTAANGELAVSEAGAADAGAGSDDKPAQYCVSGDTLTVYVKNDDGSIIMYTAKKK
jgi:hypothetical protein